MYNKDYFEAHEKEYEDMMDYIAYEQDMAQQAQEDEGPTDDEMEAMAEFYHYFYELA